MLWAGAFELSQRFEQPLHGGAHVAAGVVPFRAAHGGGAAFMGFS
jgi:hypothetical protein